MHDEKPILAQARRPQSKFPISGCLENTVCKIKFPKIFLNGKFKTENPILELPTRMPLPGFYWLPKLSTKASRQSTLGYTHSSSLSADRCTSYELDGDARHRQGFYPGSAAVWA